MSLLVIFEVLFWLVCCMIGWCVGGEDKELLFVDLRGFVLESFVVLRIIRFVDWLGIWMGCFFIFFFGWFELIYRILVK